MQHFFVSPEQVREEKIYVEGSDVNHMKNVLRMKTGEELTIGDGDGWLYVCVVESYEEDMAVLKILEKKKDESELPSKIYLFQGLPKQDKMELIVQSRGRAADTWKENPPYRDGRTYNAFGSDVPSGRVET